MRTAPRICCSVLLAIVVSGATGSSQTIQALEQLTVVDSNGRRVGPVLSIVSTVVVGFKIDGIPVVLSVLPTFFVGIAVYWESTDCSGTPLLPSGGTATLIRPVGVSVPGNTVYVPVPNGEERTVTVRSHGWARKCSSMSPWQIQAVPARVLLNLDNYFTPPFSVREFLRNEER